MRVTQSYHRGAKQINLHPVIPWFQRLQFLALGLLIAGIACAAYFLMPLKSGWLVPAALAFYAAALGLGQTTYRVKAGKFICYENSLLGLPLISSTTSAGILHSSGISGEGDGMATLRFFNALGDPVITLEGFRDAAAAQEIADLFKKDDAGRKEATDRLINERVKEGNASLSRFTGILIHGITFAFVPLAVLAWGDFLGGMGWRIGVGCFLVLMAIYLTHPKGGVLGFSKEHAFIDWWIRDGLFHVTEYRQSVTPGGKTEVLRRKFSGRNFAAVVLVLAQAGCILLTEGTREANKVSNQPAEPTPAERMADPEVQKGIDRFTVLRERRKREAAAPGNPLKKPPGETAPEPEPAGD